MTERALDRRYAIIGAGPTGLGAASRLAELGAKNVLVAEKADHVGGLAASFTDAKGFTWDLGGHVQFSHYDAFDAMMDALMGDEWLHHERESWVWKKGRFIPYPFQNNIRHLPFLEMLDCLWGAFHTRRWRGGGSGEVENFADWITSRFGEGIARHFLMPYNLKVWAYPPRELAFHWVGERVAPINPARMLTNILLRRDSISWGPNNTFRFPLSGGTGEIWRRLASRLPQDGLRLGCEVTRVDTNKRRLYFTDGGDAEYDVLISTMPVDRLVAIASLEELEPAAEKLKHSTVHVIGIGLKGAPPPHLATKCWMYFPGDETPFYRTTVFSNYSPNNVPDIDTNWSLMAEVSESPVKPVDRAGLAESVTQGLIAARLIDSPSDIVDVWQHTCPYGYPTPSLERDAALAVLLPGLEALGIMSRGRFGGWKYEVSNQDHSFMQGVEVANRLIEDAPEVTLFDPNRVNGPR